MKNSCLPGLAAVALLIFSTPAFSQLSYHIDTVAGGGRTDNGPPSSALSGDILGVAVDRWGNVYFADTDHHRICRLTSTGVLSTIAGTGYLGYEGDGGPATAATLDFPYGVAVDSSGNVYFADLGNDRVRRIGLDGTIDTVAGSGETGSLADGGKATTARLFSPRNVLVDAVGNLYISEFKGHRVRRVALDGTITTVAGTGTAGFHGDGSLAITAQIAYPAGLALDAAANLYIADSQNRRVRKVTATGLITTVVGGNDADPMPISVAVDTAGTLWVADGGSSIRRLLPGGQVTVAIGTASAGSTGDGGPVAQATLTAAHDLALDQAGSLYISDAHHIRRVVGGAQMQLVLGDLPIPLPAEGASAALAVLDHPSAVAVDGQGNLFVAETGGDRIRKVTAQGTITTIAGMGSSGFGGDGGPAGTALLNGPSGLAVEASGNLAVADTGNHRIREVLAPGWIRTLVGTGTPPAPLNGPKAVAADSAGNLYVADTLNHRVLRLSSSGMTTVLAGSGTAGYSGDGGQAILAQLNSPAAIAVDAKGNLYIADTGNNRLRKIDTSGTITTIAGTGNGDDHLQSPGGVVVDSSGNVLVADSGEHLIRVVFPDGSIQTIAGTGSPGFAGDNGPAVNAQLNTPLGMVIDSSGNILVADNGNGRVRRLTPDGQAPAQITDPPPATDASVTNAASMQSGAVAPGEIVSIFGAGMGPDRGVSAQLNSFHMLDTTLSDVQVLFDGRPAALFYVQAKQINAQAPYSIAGQSSVQVEVQYQGTTVARTAVAVGQAAPGMMTAGGGTGQALAINEDGSLNSDSNPAARGSLVTLYATGEGQTWPAGVNGEPAQAPYPQPVLPVVVRVAGNPAELLFAGSAPGFVGLMQINARVPSGFVPAGDLPVQITVGSAASQNGVTLAVK